METPTTEVDLYDIERNTANLDESIGITTPGGTSMSIGDDETESSLGAPAVSKTSLQVRTDIGNPKEHSIVIVQCSF